METKKSYRFRNAEMLLAAKTVSRSFSENIDLLSSMRNDWTREYAADLENRIDDALDRYLDIDKKKDLREATYYLASIALPARRDLTSFKTQVEVDFKNEASHILTSLGFRNYYLQVKRRNSQEGLIANLVSFGNGMTKELEEKITSRGIKKELVERIVTYSKNLKDANTIQEVLKQSTKHITKEAQEAFNGIFNEIMGICKIAQGGYEFDPIIREQFNFSKVVRNMTSAGKREESLSYK
jgi:hypothetical protein